MAALADDGDKKVEGMSPPWLQARTCSSLGKGMDGLKPS